MARIPRLACLLLLLAAALPARLDAVTYSAVSSGEVERLILTFSSDIPAFAANRSGAREILLRFDAASWSREQQPVDSEVKGGLMRFLHTTQDGVRVTLSSPDFGYVIEGGPGPNQIQLTVFADSLGSRWTPADRAQTALRQPKPVAQPDFAPAGGITLAARPDTAAVPPSAPRLPAMPDIVPDAAPDAVSGVTPVDAPQAQASPAPRMPGPATLPSSAPAPTALPETGGQQASMGGGSPSRQPFFSVPYSMRAPALDVGPDEAVIYSTTPVIGQGPRVAVNIAPMAGQPVQPMQRAQQAQQAQQAQPVQPVQPGVPAAPAGAGQDSGLQSPSASQRTSGSQATSASPPASSTSSPGDAFDPAGTASPRSDGPQRSDRSDQEAEPQPSQMEQAPALAEGEDQPVSSHEDMYQIAVRHFVNGEYTEAIEVFKKLRDNPQVEGAMREEVLHNLAQASYNLYRDELRDHFQIVVGGYEAAINFNPKSDKVPGALLQLGLAHLRVDNIPEARAYFKILMEKYPQDQNIPHIDYYWADYYFSKGRYREAAEAYQTVVQDYPDSPIIRHAALGLARSLEALEYYEQAYQIVDFIDKRWPRYYIEDPEFLRLSGELANRLQKFGEAKEDLWNYYNMQPQATGNDVVLARIGDIYLRAGQRNAARDIYRTVATRFPEDEGGLVAKMRLAEEGIYDSPTLDQMYKVFDRPFNQRPEEIYTQIVSKYPKSALAPLAQLKLAMWQLFNNRFLDSLDSVNTMLRVFPDSALVPKALEVGTQAFEQNARLMAQEENFARIVDTWDRYDFLAKRGDTLSPKARLIVATSMNEVGRPGDALEIARPLLTGAMQGESSQGAMMLAVHIYLNEEAWSQIETLAKTVEQWNLPSEQRRQFEFSLALALENLGKPELSLSLWAKLAEDMQLEPEQRGYAFYYLARAAGDQEDYRNQYLYSREALSLFSQSGQDEEKIKDCLLSLIEVCRKVSQLEQALHWALEYEKRITGKDQEWPASRFRLAEIHRGLGNDGEWHRILVDLVQEKPDSLFGRMAASTLESMTLERKVDRYRSDIDDARAP